jgi:hypothetical protein
VCFLVGLIVCVFQRERTERTEAPTDKQMNIFHRWILEQALQRHRVVPLENYKRKRQVDVDKEEESG